MNEHATIHHFRLSLDELSKSSFLHSVFCNSTSDCWAIVESVLFFPAIAFFTFCKFASNHPLERGWGGQNGTIGTAPGTTFFRRVDELSFSSLIWGFCVLDEVGKWTVGAGRGVGRQGISIDGGKWGGEDGNQRSTFFVSLFSVSPEKGKGKFYFNGLRKKEALFTLSCSQHPSILNPFIIIRLNFERRTPGEGGEEGRGGKYGTVGMDW